VARAGAGVHPRVLLDADDQPAGLHARTPADVGQQAPESLVLRGRRRSARSYQRAADGQLNRPHEQQRGAAERGRGRHERERDRVVEDEPETADRRLDAGHPVEEERQQRDGVRERGAAGPAGHRVQYTRSAAGKQSRAHVRARQVATLAGIEAPPYGRATADESRRYEVEAHEDELGPIDIVVIGYPADAPMTGEAVPILLDLVERGIIRVIDAMFVMKEADGTFSGFDARDLEARGVGDFVVFEGASSGLLGDEDMEAAAGVIEPGSAAVMIMYENRWAAPFIAAVRRNGGQLVAAERIPSQSLIDALDATEAAV
jgi:hypothetical protein